MLGGGRVFDFGGAPITEPPCSPSHVGVCTAHVSAEEPCKRRAASPRQCSRGASGGCCFGRLPRPNTHDSVARINTKIQKATPSQYRWVKSKTARARAPRVAINRMARRYRAYEREPGENIGIPLNAKACATALANRRYQLSAAPALRATSTPWEGPSSHRQQLSSRMLTPSRTSVPALSYRSRVDGSESSNA
jgi:hypothetical protein